MLSGPFAHKAELFDRIVRLLAANHAIGRTPEVNRRLQTMAQFHEDMRVAVQGVLDRYAQAGSGSRSEEEYGATFGNRSATRAR